MRATILFFAIAGLNGDRCWPQSASDDAGTIRGTVINSVTREPIVRALVSSPDNRFAALTNSEGRFEFTFAKAAPESGSGSDSKRPAGGRAQTASNRPYSLAARKPGFLADPNSQANNLLDASNTLKDLTLMLTPESVIAGTVTLPTSEPPDSITLQLFSRKVMDGRVHWVQAGSARSMSDGEFRFADLPAGSYKLLTSELLDRDPLISDPRTDPFAPDSRAPIFGYPPVYYQSASDFGSASTITLAAGQTQTVDLSLVKQPYYRVRVPVVMPPAAPGNDSSEFGLSVSVYAHGHKGPGFSLIYNNLHHAIEGMLPEGSYTIEVTSLRPDGVSGWRTLTIKGDEGSKGETSKIESPSLTLLPKVSIPVNVKEEFTSADPSGATTFTINGRNTAVKGPRRYLDVILEPADDFGMGRSASLRAPTTPSDDALVVEGVSAGTYWVRVHSSRGYPAAIRAGYVDLQHRPLVVSGGGTIPIEITMRDDKAEIGGKVEGIPPAAQSSDGDAVYPGRRVARVYCIPLADSSGEFTEIRVHQDGSFDSAEMAPGAYRLLAFDGEPRDFEYRNPEAIQAYDSKGPVVRVAGGQKERVTLQVTSASLVSGVASNEQ